MDNTHELYDKRLRELIEEAASFDLESDEATTAMRNLEVFSKIRPPAIELDPEPEPEPIVPTTVWEKTKASLGCVWDNETTRVFIKAGGAFAGVALIAYSTIHKDHVIERQALSQANQRNS